MGRAIPQHRVGRYRFLSIEDTWRYPVAEGNGFIADIWRVEDVCTEKRYAVKTIPLSYLTPAQAQLLREHLSTA